MPRTKKVITHETVRCLVTLLQMIKSQPAKAPMSKADLATGLGLKTSELTNECKLIESKQWATRRTGPDARGIYYKVTAKGTAAIKAYSLLYS